MNRLGARSRKTAQSIAFASPKSNTLIVPSARAGNLTSSSTSERRCIENTCRLIVGNRGYVLPVSVTSSREALQLSKRPVAQPPSLLPGPRQAIAGPERVSKHLPGQHAESERPVGHSSNAIAIAVSESIACPSFQRAANRVSPNAFRAALN